LERLTDLPQGEAGEPGKSPNPHDPKPVPHHTGHYCPEQEPHRTCCIFSYRVQDEVQDGHPPLALAFRKVKGFNPKHTGIIGHP